MAGEDQLETLTPRENEVLAFLRRGLTDAAIAEQLGISEAGASYHVSEIIGKLGVRDRYGAAAWPDSAPWWTKAVLPFITLWRKASPLPNSLALAAIGSAALLLVGGAAVMVTLLLRTHADGDHNARALTADSTKPPDFTTFPAIVLSSPTRPPVPSTDKPTPLLDIATETLTPAASPTIDVTAACLLPSTAYEIFPPAAAEYGQRIFINPSPQGERWYLRSDGACALLRSGPPWLLIHLPDYLPDDSFAQHPVGVLPPTPTYTPEP